MKRESDKMGGSERSVRSKYWHLLFADGPRWHKTDEVRPFLHRRIEGIRPHFCCHGLVYCKYPEGDWRRHDEIETAAFCLAFRGRKHAADNDRI
jgi:hypothetical protein